MSAGPPIKRLKQALLSFGNRKQKSMPVPGRGLTQNYILAENLSIKLNYIVAATGPIPWLKVV